MRLKAAKKNLLSQIIEYSIVFVFVFIYLPHDYNNYIQKDAKKKKCRNQYYGSLQMLNIKRLFPKIFVGVYW